MGERKRIIRIRTRRKRAKERSKKSETVGRKGNSRRMERRR